MSFFKGLAGKLSVLAGISALGLIVSSFVAIYGVNALDSTIFSLSEKRIPITRLIGEVRTQMNAVSRTTWQVVAANDSVKRAEQKKNLQARIESLNETFKSLETIGLVPKNKENLKVLKSKWELLQKQYFDIIAESEKNDLSKSLALMGETSASMDQLASLLVEMGNVMLETNIKTRQESRETVNRVKAILVSIAGLFIFFSIGLAVFLIVRLTKSFQMISENLGTSGGNVSAASEELVKASALLSSATVQAASSIEETVASIEEISSQVSRSADLAGEAQNLGRAARQVAQKGEGHIQNLLQSMSEIESSANQMQEIVGLIDDIAFQTNLLALNAAVEAARAGEQGKGFAVVAEAVRALSQRSASSAKEISNLIKQSSEKTKNGVGLAKSSHEVVSEILSSVDKLTNLNSEVATALREQALGINQISKATSQLDEATQANASTSEEAAATAEELSAQSGELHRMVKELRFIVHGSEEEIENRKKQEPKGLLDLRKRISAAA